MKVSTFKLIGGEFIIANEIERNEKSITLEDALLLAIQPMPGENKMSISFLPFNPFGKRGDKITLSLSNIQLEIDIPDDIKNMFIKRTSNIIIPNVKK